MRTLLLLALFCGAAAFAQQSSDRVDLDPSQAGPEPGRRAVIVGISRYPGLEQTFPWVAEPSRQVPKFLQSVRGGKFGTVATFYDDKATYEALSKAIEDLTADPAPARAIALGFSGRGWKDPKTGKDFLVPYDGNCETLERLIPVDDVRRKLARTTAETRLAFLHTCVVKPVPAIAWKPGAFLDWHVENVPVDTGTCSILTCLPEQEALAELGQPPLKPPPPSKTGTVKRKGLTYLGQNARGYEEYRNEKDGSILIYVPGGTFCLGHGSRFLDTIPRRKVTVPPYLIGKFEVSLGQFKKFCSETPFDLPKLGWWKPQDNEPIEEIMWHDAVAYADWAGLRLPTEAEWEYAARGNDGRLYPWGNEAPNEGGLFRANLYGDDSLGLANDPVLRTAPVDAFPEGASPFGALNMLGNVMEWCADRYDPFYYLTAETFNPQGPSAGKLRVRRGGAWSTKAEECAAGFRGANDPTEQWEDTGFRIACTP